MYIKRQILMTIFPSATSQVIANEILFNVLNQGLSFTGQPGHERFGQILAAALKRSGLKNIAIDVLSLPTRLVVGMDKPPVNVPPYHKGYLSAAPEPLPGAMKACAMMVRGLGFMAGKVAAFAGIAVGLAAGAVCSLGGTVEPQDVAFKCAEVGMMVGQAPFEAIAWAIEILPKAHRKIFNALLSKTFFISGSAPSDQFEPALTW
jgi:hypothetical protein